MAVTRSESRETTASYEAKSRRSSGPDAFDAAWDEFFSAVRRARGRAAREADTEGLSLAQFHLLSAFLTGDDADSWSVGSLAESAGLAPPTATRMLDGLEREGIVERRRSSEDRRSVTVKLTRRGRHLLRRKRERVAAKRRAIYESLTPAERRRAEALLRRLAAAVEQL